MSGKGKSLRLKYFDSCSKGNIYLYYSSSKALEKNNRTGSARLLIDGIRFFISKESDDSFENTEIEVNLDRFKLNEYLPLESK